MVGNGHELECYQWFREVLLRVQGQELWVNFHVLSLCGTNLVLYVEWLKSLGLVLTDYNDLNMKFIHGGLVV